MNFSLAYNKFYLIILFGHYYARQSIINFFAYLVDTAPALI